MNLRVVPDLPVEEMHELDGTAWALILAQAWESVRDEPPGLARLALIEHGIWCAKTFRSSRARHLNEGAGT
jgi:hypothetical protein